MESTIDPDGLHRGRWLPLLRTDAHGAVRPRRVSWEQPVPIALVVPNDPEVVERFELLRRDFVLESRSADQYYWFEVKAKPPTGCRHRLLAAKMRPEPSIRALQRKAESTTACHAKHSDGANQQGAVIPEVSRPKNVEPE